MGCDMPAALGQTILLRKGGMAETAGEFQLEHETFWLYPTYVHQQHEGIGPHLRPPLQEVQKNQPLAGIVRFTHFATAPRAYLVNSLDSLLSLQDLHGWSEETVRARFTYRWPGLFVIPVRVYRAAKTHELSELVEYAGCKSWVDLTTELATDGGKPVLEDAAFASVVERLNHSVPTA
jgi:hypothetical protein